MFPYIFIRIEEELPTKMTVEKQIQDKIYELINNVNKTIPVDWDELYINSEMSETGGNVYFFLQSSR